MKGIWNISLAKKLLLYLFFSPECICVIVLVILYFTKLIPFDEIGIFFFRNEDNNMIKWITIPLPVAFFLSSLAMYKLLTQPEGNNKILYNWDKYVNYRLTARIGLFFCFLPIFPTFFSWVLFNIYSEYDVGFFYVLLNLISVISLVTMFFAQDDIKHFLQKYS